MVESYPTSDWELFDTQKEALSELKEHRQGFFSIGVGGGKTLLAMLAAKVLDIDPADTLILSLAELRDEAAFEWEKYKEHFDVPWSEFVSYTFISRNEKYFWEKKPKLIIADECHKLKRKQSNRTHFFIRYMREHPGTIFVPMSGTITTRSITEYAHLLYLALGDDCPLPNPNSSVGWPRIQSLARVLDSRPTQEPTQSDYRIAGYILDPRPDEGWREAFLRVLNSAPGVYLNEGVTFDGPISVQPWKPEIPDDVKQDIKKVKSSAQMPNEEWVSGATEQAQKVKQLSQGFYYYPIWKDCHTPEWRRAKRAKDELVSSKIRSEKRKKWGRITRSRVENAFEQDIFTDPVWNHWEQFKDVPEPEREIQWQSEEILEQALDFCAELGGGTLLWYLHRAVRDKLESVLDSRGGRWYDSDVVVVPRGEAPPRGDGKPDISVVSIRSHSTGLNLQHDYNKNVILLPPSNGGAWEQLLGRTHRPGQTEEVRAYYNASLPVFRWCFTKAKRDARYVEETIEQKQRLLLAEKCHEDG